MGSVESSTAGLGWRGGWLTTGSAAICARTSSNLLLSVLTQTIPAVANTESSSAGWSALNSTFGNGAGAALTTS